MTGDGESQPVGDADAFADLEAALIGGESEATKPEESESEESVESEEVESEEGEAEESEEAEEDPTVKIVHDGKEVELKLSEVKALAQQGYDYTKKTMAVAEKDKAVEAERARISEARAKQDAAADEVVGRLESFKTYLQAQLGEAPSVDLIQQYGAEYYLAQKELHEQRKGQLQQAEAAIAHQTSERQRERQAHLHQTANQTIAALRDTLPGWNDSTLPDLEKYVNGYGLTVENSEAGYVQKGLWELAHKAKAYDAIQAAKAQMKAKAPIAKVQAPVAQNTSAKVAERVKREAAFNKNPSVDALAALLK